MKFANLIGNATQSVGVYDKTKLSTFGNVSARTINTKTCYGPFLTKFIDVQTDFLASIFTMSGVEYQTQNNRKFILSTSSAAGIVSLAAYNFNTVTGAYSAIGRILITLPSAAATTHTMRYLVVDDSGASGTWKAYVGTIGTVAANGGSFLINKIDIADFSMSPTPTQYYMAQASNVKGVYMLQDPTAVGAAHAMTTLIGGDLDFTLNQVLTVKGTAATLSHDGFDHTVAPTYVTQNSTAVNVNAGVTTFNLTAHGYNNNDQIIILSGAPTGFSNSLSGAIQTVYFVRNAAANTFELSATSGGASILGSSVTSQTFGRAFGTVTNIYLASRKTASITTGFAGTQILLNNAQIITPANGTNAGVRCFFFPTTTNFYCYPLTTITAGATVLSSVHAINNLGSGSDITAPATVLARYSEVLGKIVYTTASFGFILKSWQNSVISTTFGTQINTWLEAQNHAADYFRGFTTSGLMVRNGVIFVTVTTTGQRGILFIDGRSDHSIGYSKLITPVFTLNGPAILKFVTSLEQLFDITDSVNFYYRTGATYADANFATDTSGVWTEISTADDLSAITAPGFIQIMIDWNVLTTLSGIPTQIVDLILGYESLIDTSKNWAPCVDGSTQGAGSPSDTVWELRVAYPTSVPTLYAYDFDKTTFSPIGSVLNTAANPTNFAYSTDGGLSFLPLGTIPNVVGTRVRRRRSSPPGVDVQTSLRES